MRGFKFQDSSIQITALFCKCCYKIFELSEREREKERERGRGRGRERERETATSLERESETWESTPEKWNSEIR